MSKLNPAVVTNSETDESDYRPFKRWSLSRCVAVNVVLIKRDTAPCIAACPALGLRCEGKEYLEASFELSRQIIAKLELPPNSTFTSTCIPPFDLESGQDSEVQSSPRRNNDKSHLLDEETDRGSWATPELTKVLNMARSESLQVKAADLPHASASSSTVEEEQLDLFG